MLRPYAPAHDPQGDRRLGSEVHTLSNGRVLWLTIDKVEHLARPPVRVDATPNSKPVVRVGSLIKPGRLCGT
ncbi:hypothetical protein MOX02_55450 [Methylobacterium oxalidis]|uniref:Uncharacterized protein n=1 Tax=Methylobacterium oxalidis TaxID=944322 RepID=A0A512JC29_9HYPH|nr:hypothetical protein MOX02_55450 [Methylobacterium oxalidis]GLS65200.1 hypothetical protein GCM10007888_35820 [Methylobacterium oxalidis]